MNSNSDALIKNLTLEMQKDTQHLEQKKREVHALEEEDKKLEEEIKQKTKQIEDLKLQIRTAETKINHNKGLHGRLLGEVHVAELKVNKIHQDLTRAQQDLTATLKKSGMNLK